VKEFLLTAALCAAPLLSASAASRVEAQIGAWDIVAATDDRTGQFTQCITFVPYKNGINMMFSIDAAFRWSMVFQNPSWRLTQGSKYPINYWIDNSPTIPADALVLAPDMVVVDLFGGDALFETFKRGHNLTLQAAGSQFDFALKDSSRALQAAIECTSRYAPAAPGPGTNPFATQQQAQAEADESAFKIEAATYTANLLSSAGIPGFQIVETPPKGFEKFHSAFISPSMTGGMIIAPSWTVEAAANEMQAAFSQGCSGKLATAKSPMQGVGTHVQLVCEHSDGFREEGSLFVLPRPKGGVYSVIITQVPQTAAGPPPAFGGSPVQALPPPQSAGLSPDDISTKMLDASSKIAK
jgi:hypothetical protein